MRKFRRFALAGAAFAAVSAAVVAVSGQANASPASSGSLECSYRVDHTTKTLTGQCGANSLLGYTGGTLSGSLDTAGKTASGSASLCTALASLDGSFQGTLPAINLPLSGTITIPGVLGPISIPFTALPI